MCIFFHYHVWIKMVVTRVFSEPWGVHRYYVQYMKSNFKDWNFKRKFFEMVWTTSYKSFDRFYSVFTTLNNGQLRCWLLDCSDFSLCLQLYDARCTYGVMTTNQSYAFSKYLFLSILVSGMKRQVWWDMTNS